jgi:hypothetical protein
MGDISGSKGDRFRTMATPEEVQAAMKSIYTDAEANEGPNRDLCQPVTTVVCCWQSRHGVVVDLVSVWGNISTCKGAEWRSDSTVLDGWKLPNQYLSWFEQLHVEPRWYSNIVVTRCQSEVRSFVLDAYWPCRPMKDI